MNKISPCHPERLTERSRYAGSKGESKDPGTISITKTFQGILPEPYVEICFSKSPDHQIARDHPIQTILPTAPHSPSIQPTAPALPSACTAAWRRLPAAACTLARPSDNRSRGPRPVTAG